MEKAGLIVREDAPPPVATALFHLTERGAKLRPVVEALAGWGGPLVTRPIGDDEFRSHWLALPLQLHLSDHAPERHSITIELRSGDHPIPVKTLDGKVRARPGRADHPAAVRTGPGS